MSLFARRPRAVEQRSISFQDVWGKGLDWAAYTGVNETTVTGLDAVGASMGLLTDVIEMMPVDTFRDRDGVADPMVSSPNLVASPSSLVDPLVWRAQALASLLLWGNAYGFVTNFTSLQYPDQVDWLDPALMEVEEHPLRRPVFRYAGQVLPPDRVLHMVGRYVRPGSSIGIAPLERFKETFALALLARKFGSDWFRNGAIPSAVVTSKGSVNEESAEIVKERVKSATKNREPLVIGDDVSYQQVQVDAEESQFGVTLDRQAVAVARVFGLPPEMIGAVVSGLSVTYANREQRAIDFLTFAIDPWLVRFEQMWTRNLPKPQYARFNRGALLRTDLLTRYKAHDTAIRGGWQNADGVRALEDMGPIPNGKGKEYLWPPYATSITPTAPTQDGNE